MADALADGSTCAQRLSASKDSPRRVRANRRSLVDVLNACRRQRILHASENVTDLDVRRVLNACRRQRILHIDGRDITDIKI